MQLIIIKHDVAMPSERFVGKIIPNESEILYEFYVFGLKGGRFSSSSCHLNFDKNFSWLNASSINNPPDPEKVVAFFKEAESKELELLRRVRKKNDAKATSRISSCDETPPSSQTDPEEVSRQN